MGCDNKHYIGFIPLTGFQSTHPSGVRPRGLSSRNRLTAFQSTHPSGVRHFSYGGRDGDNQFQSTHPSGVRPITGIKPGSTSLFQSTHPSGVRQGSCDCDRIIRDISIHAPQWGATGKSTRRRDSRNFNPRTPVGCDARRDRRLDRAMRISIHAPQWGATAKYTPSMTIREEFQSTHPSGVRPDRMPLCEGLAEISIHAPQWGATSCPTRGRRAACDFNPRTPVGCDWRKTGRTRYSRIFQSTHPSGVRPVVSSDGTLSRYFNPRTPVGCDSSRLAGDAYRSNFNPRTPVGCDLPPHLGHGLIL